MIDINPEWLVDTITIELYKGEGDYNEAVYGELIACENCRVDLSKVYSGTGNDRTISANATAYLFAPFTSNFPSDISDEYLKARVVYEGKTYQVSNWKKWHGITSNEPFSVELELI